ncbi:hypothetical protein LOTGIDRAFT_161300 [Lottia gigantea]|uniref:C-type lectin domain-containing protein n=1 Tax=Lottia gigantea TaxID=225164 RepID=V4ACL9_LOTGI|nr:hypothetical protein LOTGIDRAFT_161300 [Lottia gigantea]ESO94597.1 hypothetical protein LOTGIDRAFT_161300 [Lottia gigantea]
MPPNVQLTFSKSTFGNCPKFVGKDGRSNPVTFNEICYYPFPVDYTYSDAKSLCDSQDTRLPVLDEEVKQIILNGLAGFMVSSYWTSLEYIDNIWYWVDGSNKYLMANPRWIDDPPLISTYAYTTTDRHWGRISTPITKQVICEDDHTPPTVQGVLPFRKSGCNAMSYALNLKELNLVKAPSVIGCAAICMDTISCEYLKYNLPTSQCQLYTAGGNLNIFDCFLCTS